MSQDVYARIRANPKYQHLVKTRNGYGKIMTIIMFIVYYGYISLIAFDKELLATPRSIFVLRNNFGNRLPNVEFPLK